MKIVKTLIIAVVTLLSVHAAKAQVSVHARIGARPVQHRTVVVRRPAYHHRRIVSYRRYYANHRWHRRPVYRYYYHR